MTEPVTPKQTRLERGYSLAEELANSITHGLGALLSVAGLTLLVTYAALQNDIWRVVSFSVYGTTLILLFLASTLYHSFQHSRTKQVFKLLDHCAIYLLIAGTYTPFLLVSIRGTTGWILFAVIWLLALTGIVFKLVFPGRFHKAAVATYLLMGWLAVIASKELIAKLSLGGMVWLAAGGLSYSLGVIFYVWNRLPFNHAIWHLFVLGGSICHFFAVYLYVLPSTPG
ncbi:PAQR family membrane homeostasis protein TrhA [Candidatus Sororendozoicomonas aggregata]|uniref:PAQR family membrane homeostasis protein TrhA n=1 Tax=Candidatus Sororendozoicomonas aggregata TaxID=3073239 RepID=UPI002ED0F695